MRRSRRQDDWASLEDCCRDAPQRARRIARTRRAMGPGRWLIALAAAAGFATLVAYPPGEAADAAATQAKKPVAKWVDADKQDELFKLEAAALEGMPRTYIVNRHATGNGREDIITFGRPADARGYMRLEIRQAMPSGADAGLFVSLVRRAADAGLAITRAGQVFSLPTRLGSFDASEVTLAADAHEWPCTGLRLRTTDTRLQITGLACAEGGKRPAPPALACTLDALGLAPGSDESSLRGFFQEAQRRRGSLCQMQPPKAASSQADPPPPPPTPTRHRNGARHRSAALL